MNFKFEIVKFSGGIQLNIHYINPKIRELFKHYVYHIDFKKRKIFRKHQMSACFLNKDIFSFYFHDKSESYIQTSYDNKIFRISGVDGIKSVIHFNGDIDLKEKVIESFKIISDTYNEYKV